MGAASLGAWEPWQPWQPWEPWEPREPGSLGTLGAGSQPTAGSEPGSEPAMGARFYGRRIRTWGLGGDPGPTGLSVGRYPGLLGRLERCGQGCECGLRVE